MEILEKLSWKNGKFKYGEVPYLALAAWRIIVMIDSALLSNKNTIHKLESLESIGIDNEMMAVLYGIQTLESYFDSCATSIEKDHVLLKKIEIPPKLRNIILFRKREKEILHSILTLLYSIEEHLMLPCAETPICNSLLERTSSFLQK